MKMIAAFVKWGRGFIFLPALYSHKYTQCQLSSVVALQSDLVLAVQA